MRNDKNTHEGGKCVVGLLIYQLTQGLPKSRAYIILQVEFLLNSLFMTHCFLLLKEYHPLALLFLL